MELKSFSDIEKYLKGKQVYFAHEICDTNFKTIFEAGHVYKVQKIDIIQVRKDTVCIEISADNLTGLLYLDDYDTNFDLYEWVKRMFIPLNVILDAYYQTINNGK